MSGKSEPAGEHTDVYAAQQQAIIDVLDHCGGQSNEIVERRLRQTLEARNIPVPPGPWLRAVVSEIAQDRLYVVANGMVPNEYFSSSTGARAGDRAELAGHDMEPSTPSEEQEQVGPI